MTSVHELMNLADVGKIVLEDARLVVQRDQEKLPPDPESLPLPYAIRVLKMMGEKSGLAPDRPVK